MSADVERRMLLEEASRLEEGHSLADVTRLTEIEMRLEEIGSATAGERAKALLRNLGFTEALMVSGSAHISVCGVMEGGGWRACK